MTKHFLPILAVFALLTFSFVPPPALAHNASDTGVANGSGHGNGGVGQGAGQGATHGQGVGVESDDGGGDTGGGF